MSLTTMTAANMTIETRKTWKILALGKITFPITERRVCCEQLVEICTFLQLDHNQAEVCHTPADLRPTSDSYSAADATSFTASSPTLSSTLCRVWTGRLTASTCCGRALLHSQKPRQKTLDSLRQSNVPRDDAKVYIYIHVAWLDKDFS